MSAAPSGDAFEHSTDVKMTRSPVAHDNTRMTTTRPASTAAEDPRSAHVASGDAAATVDHLLLGPPEHGVTRHGAALAGARRTSMLDVGTGARDLAAYLADDAGPVHVHLTDALLGADHRAIEAGVRAIEGAARPVHVTLHDIPQPAEGQARYERRAALYARIVAAAASVQVCSEAERAMLGDVVAAHAGDADSAARGFGDADVAGVGVVTLPVDARPSATAAGDAVLALGDDAPVGVLGFVHPGKDPQLALDVAAALGRDLVLLGAVVEGHEDFVDDLRRAANARGIELRVLGHLSEDEMDAAIATIAVPLAAYRHISASGSIGRWIAAGRRPITLATPWVTELSTTAPGSVAVVEASTDAGESGDRDGVIDVLVDAARAALSDPMVTVTNPSHPGLLTTPDAARRQTELLAAHLTSLGGVG